MQPALPHRAIWSIALPAMLTNLATALFGIADLWVIGRLGDAPAQGAVEIGAKLMMGILVAFNFLRTASVGLTAQAAGRGEMAAQTATLVRAVALALTIGLALLLLWPVAVPLGVRWLGGDGQTGDFARLYANIRYPGGILWLVNAALAGWLIGLRQVRAVLVIEVGANIAHVALDLTLVLGLHWGVAGVATATLCSEALKLGATAFMVSRQPAARLALATVRDPATWAVSAVAKLLRVNRDLFIRTLILTFALLLFTRLGADQGAVTLAANGILYQLFMVTVLMLDGFESAAQVLAGEAVGANDRVRFETVTRAIFGWGLATAVLLAAVMLVGGRVMAANFSTDPQVIAAVALYWPWLVLLPVLGVVPFVFDGLFIGATWTRAMLTTMASAFAAYAAALWLTTPLGNTGLWLSLAVFTVVRAGAQAWVLPRLKRRTFAY